MLYFQSSKNIRPNLTADIDHQVMQTAIDYSFALSFFSNDSRWKDRTQHSNFTYRRKRTVIYSLCAACDCLRKSTITQRDTIRDVRVTSLWYYAARLICCAIVLVCSAYVLAFPCRCLSGIVAVLEDNRPFCLNEKRLFNSCRHIGVSLCQFV